MEYSDSVLARFWSKVDKSGDCWVWTAARMPSPMEYGVFGIRAGMVKRAHRFSWELSNGDIPVDLCVLHRCDNPPCVNPDHLFLGTRVENIADMVAKGRNAKGDKHRSRKYPERLLRGEDSPSARLSEMDVKSIRARVAAGESQYSVAAAFGIKQPYVSLVVNRKRWKHV